MGNILNHNRDIIQFDLCKEDYWDFHISLERSGHTIDDFTDRCLSAFIDISQNEQLKYNEDILQSSETYRWDNCVTDNSLVFDNFGYTSVDNGRTHYEVDSISNEQFLNIFTNTKLKFDDSDCRLTLGKIYGNHKIYDYSTELMLEEGKQILKLNGGFYQGFFCANDGKQYKVLPTELGDGWTFEFILKKEDFVNEKTTLNDQYPENKGIFFYIGTRSENKWWEKYKTDHDFEKCDSSGIDSEYVGKDYLDETNLNGNYFNNMPILDWYENGFYFSDDYLTDENSGYESPFAEEYIETPSNCDYYISDDYFGEETPIDENADIITSDGNDVTHPKETEIKTDNKFVIFDRTKKGFTTKTWDDDIEFYLTLPKRPDVGNLFTLMNRTPNGYTVKTLEKLIEEKNKEYNVLSDLYRNALAFQIKDDGSIGYKYLVKDCESEDENYKIETEFSFPNTIIDKKWEDIHISLIPVKHRNRYVNKCLVPTVASDTMRIWIYVNGKLVFVSKVLPIINLKALNDSYEKQEGIPFNLSLGGGTQGLAETVTLNYRKRPEYTLPLEKEFGGTFIGYLRVFRFFTCPLKFTEIKTNYKLIEKTEYL